MHRIVFVPIRGLFNLTDNQKIKEIMEKRGVFPSPSGDYLI